MSRVLVVPLIPPMPPQMFPLGETDSAAVYGFDLSAQVADAGSDPAALALSWRPWGTGEAVVTSPVYDGTANIATCVIACPTPARLYEFQLLVLWADGQIATAYARLQLDWQRQDRPVAAPEHSDWSTPLPWGAPAGTTFLTGADGWVLLGADGFAMTGAT